MINKEQLDNIMDEMGEYDSPDSARRAFEIAFGMKLYGPVGRVGLPVAVDIASLTRSKDEPMAAGHSIVYLELTEVNDKYTWTLEV